MVDFEKETHSKVPYYLLIAFMYILGGGLIFFQVHQFDSIAASVTDNVTSPVFYAAAPYLIVVGYILFIASLIMMGIHFRKIFREEAVFQKSEASKDVKSGRRGLGEKERSRATVPNEHLIGNTNDNLQEEKNARTGESKLWDLLLTSSRKGSRLGMIIPIVFALTTVITGLMAVFLPDTYEGAIQVVQIGISIGFSIILIFYLNVWFSCLAFLRETKQLDIADEKLRRLIRMNRVSSILFMIPIFFFVGLAGFFRVKAYAEGNVQKGTLDQIIYHYFIDKNEVEER
jgi:hypothetical protein